MKKIVLLLICAFSVMLFAMPGYCEEDAYFYRVEWVKPMSAHVVVNCKEIPEGAVTIELYNSSDELVSSAAVQYSDMEYGMVFSDWSTDIYTTVDFFDGTTGTDTFYFIVKGLGCEVKSDVYYYGHMLDLVSDGNYGVSYSDCFDDKIYIGIIGRGDTPYCWYMDTPDAVEEKSIVQAGLPYDMLGAPIITLHEFKPVKEGKVCFNAKLKTPPGPDGEVVSEFYLTYNIDKDLKVTFEDWEYTGFKLPDDEAYYYGNGYIEFYKGYDENVVIPKEINGAKIFGIGPDTFRSNDNIKSVDIPETIISIIGDEDYDSYTFLGASNLESITVNENNPVFKDIDGVLVNKATNQLLFYPVNKAGEVYNIPEEITSVKGYAFYELNNLQYVYVDNDSLEFEPDAFGYVDVTFVCRRGSTAEAYADSYYRYKVKYIAKVGDADASGVLTANDASAALAFTLDSSFENDTYQLDKVCDVDGDGIVSAKDSALILQKVLDADMVLPVYTDR